MCGDSKAGPGEKMTKERALFDALEPLMVAELATCRPTLYSLPDYPVDGLPCTTAPRDPQETLATATTRRNYQTSNFVGESPRRVGQHGKIVNDTKRQSGQETQTTGDMVIGLLVLTSIPTVTGVAQGISAKKQENAKLKEKIKFNMTATLAIDGGPPKESWIVLAAGRVSRLISPVPA